MPAPLIYSTSGASLSSGEIAFAHQVAASFSPDMNRGWAKVARFEVDGVLVEYNSVTNIAFVTTRGSPIISSVYFADDYSQWMLTSPVAISDTAITVPAVSVSPGAIPQWFGLPKSRNSPYMVMDSPFSVVDGRTFVDIQLTKMDNHSTDTVRVDVTEHDPLLNEAWVSACAKIGGDDLFILELYPSGKVGVVSRKQGVFVYSADIVSPPNHLVSDNAWWLPHVSIGSAYVVQVKVVAGEVVLSRVDLPISPLDTTGVNYIRYAVSEYAFGATWDKKPFTFATERSVVHVDSAGTVKAAVYTAADISAVTTAAGAGAVDTVYATTTTVPPLSDRLLWVTDTEAYTAAVARSSTTLMGEAVLLSTTAATYLTGYGGAAYGEGVVSFLDGYVCVAIMAPGSGMNRITAIYDLGGAQKYIDTSTPSSMGTENTFVGVSPRGIYYASYPYSTYVRDTSEVSLIRVDTTTWTSVDCGLAPFEVWYPALSGYVMVTPDTDFYYATTWSTTLSANVSHIGMIDQGGQLTGVSVLNPNRAARAWAFMSYCYLPRYRVLLVSDRYDIAARCAFVNVGLPTVAIFGATSVIYGQSTTIDAITYFKEWTYEWTPSTQRSEWITQMRALQPG